MQDVLRDAMQAQTVRRRLRRTHTSTVRVRVIKRTCLSAG
jgi:hypothetical protein